MMPTLEVNGFTAHYRDEGTGPPVILLHSSCSNSGQWRALIESLCDRHRVLAPDLIAYGRTDPWPEGRNSLLDDELAIVFALFDIAGEPVHLIGHSYGGGLSAWAATRHPDRIASLTLIEPTLFYLLDEAGEEEAEAELRGVAAGVIENVAAGDLDLAAEGFISYWLAPGALAAMPDDRREAIVQVTPKLCHEWVGAFAEHTESRPALGDISVPVLIVETGETTPAARRVTKVLRDRLPKHDFIEIPGVGHMAPLTDPGAVNPVIVSFLERQER